MHVFYTLPAAFIATLIGLLVLCGLGTGLFIYFAKRKNRLMDHPIERSSHTKPTPRGGGLVFGVLWLGYLSFLFLHTRLLLIPLCLILLTGFLSDLCELKARYRFLLQVLASMIFLFELFYLNQAHIVFSFPLFFVIFILFLFSLLWSTNLFNFMDGTDGLAATESLCVLGFGGLFLYWQDALLLAYASWGLCALVSGFLLWNWPRASIFMGDSGSYLLGFSICVFAILGVIYHGLELTVWFILYGLFWFDASVTLLRRLLKKQVFWQAHKHHAFQRLHQAGFSHQKVLLTSLAINSLLAAVAFFQYFHPTNKIISISLTLVILTLHTLYAELKKPLRV